MCVKFRLFHCGGGVKTSKSNERKNQAQRIRVLRRVLLASAPGDAEAEVLPVLVARRHLRGVLGGADWLRSRSPVQPQGAGRSCLCRKALHHQARSCLLKASETPQIRALVPWVVCLVVSCLKSGTASKSRPFRRCSRINYVTLQKLTD